jgi:hypothetical protein
MVNAALPSHTICFVAVNGYECDEKGVLIYAAIVCFISSFATVAFAGSIIAYRWYHGVFTSLFRCIDGYWLPKPIDIILVGWCMEKTLRTISYLCTLTDWPESILFRGILYLLATALVTLVILQFVVGIIVYIPAAFAHDPTKNTHDLQALPNNSRDNNITSINEA